MIIFKILLIILCATPVIALAAFLYYKALEYTKELNRRDARRTANRRGMR